MFMLHSFARPLVSLAVLIGSAHALGQRGFWTPEDGARNAAPAIDVAEHRTFHLDVESLERWLDQVPVAPAFEARESEVLIELPLADGTFETFRVVNSPIMAPALAERYPEIQVYAGQGVDSPEATVRFDLPLLFKDAA